ncbi:hypothetical protein EV363DRAFT_1340503 [Boletus edulis]|nr:hypothetical protein EV363DRAFT_1340503 [Boletus edulis]
MDSESRPTSPVPEFDVRARIDQFSSLLSRTIICFCQFLASDSESEGPRRRLLDEYITVGGAANSTKILLDTSDERKAEGYLERRRKIESLWVPEGPLAQFAAHMENAYNIMSNAIEEHKKVATPTRRRGPFPVSLEMLNEEIRLIQVYKQQTADVLYDDFYKSHRKLDPKIQLAVDIVEWLGFIDVTDREEFMSRERHEGTCNWIFNPDVCQRYHEWWSATEGFLWIRGKAASGKSVILAAIVDRIFKELWKKIEEQEKRDGYKREFDEPPYILPEFFPAFYFFDFRDTRSLKTSTFFKSLFVQFLQVPEPDLAVTFPDLTKRYLDGLPPPTDLETFQGLVLRAMRSHEKKAIFVDGLNECDDVPVVMAFLERAMQEANVRVLVASRPDPDILAKYRGRPTINLEDYIGCTNADMREWLMKRMMDHSRLHAIPEHKKIEVLDAVTKYAEGSFWHAQCIVDSLEVCRSVAQVNIMIREAPTDLETIHYNLLRRVNERSEDVQLIVSMAIRWLGGALRPLSLSQIIEVVQIELGHTPPLRLNDDLTVVTPEDMLMLCGNLVKIDDRTARLGLGHPTVRNFLTQPPPEDEKFSRYFFDAHAIHRDLALRSITYIMTDDIEKAIAKSYTQAFMFDISRRYSIVDRCPMLTYVFEGGFEHLRYYTQEDDDAIDLLVLLQNHIPEKPDKFSEVLQALHDRTEDTPYQWIVEEKELALGVLVRFGPPWMLKRYLLRRRDLVEGEEKDKLVRWAEKIGRYDLGDMLVAFELPELMEKMEVGSQGREQAPVGNGVGPDSQDVMMADEQ